MAIVYVASIGQTAATKSYYWRDARERFRYTESVLICSKQLVESVSRFLDKNANLIVVDSPFYGADGYVTVVKAIVKQVMAIVKAHEKRGHWIDEIVVNTAGGTEKMSCIIKDAVDVLRRLFPYVTHVWGATNGYETAYTVKPTINLDDICAPFERPQKEQCVQEELFLPCSLKKQDSAAVAPVPQTVPVSPQVATPETKVVSEPRTEKVQPKKAKKCDENTTAIREAALAERKRQKEAKRLAREETRQRRHKEYIQSLKQKKQGVVSSLLDAVEEWFDEKVDDLLK